MNIYRAVVILLIGLTVLIGAWALMDAEAERVWQERGDAYVAACQARPSVVVTLDGQTWDLAACG